MIYSYGNHSFKLTSHGGHEFDHHIEISRQRGYEEVEIYTSIGMFYNETFTGMTVFDWGDDENQTPWKYIFQSVEVTASAFKSKLVDWLGEEDAQKFVGDLNRNRSGAYEETLKFWQRDTAFPK